MRGGGGGGEWWLGERSSIWQRRGRKKERYAALR
jgi:hypothetical protein